MLKFWNTPIMATDPNHDPQAMVASKSPDEGTGGDLGSKHKRLIIFLIIVLIFIIPLGGLMVLSYTNKTSNIPYVSDFFN